MKKVLFWLFAIVILLPGSALAQQPPISKATTNPGTTPAKPSTPAVIPTGRVAVIDTTQFPKGILEYKKELDKLEAEFQPRTKELETLKTRLDALQKELENAPMMKPEVQQQKVAEYESIKKEAQRKFEDYQADVSKRSGAVLAPLNEKISRFLQGYATSHN
ncbi:MAG TPA: OmpH family outer membrane protein, partial [Acidobacteriota bacterium]|nr:OmpH family outer membrane protein [Acidobacteriota bacterium]